MSSKSIKNVSASVRQRLLNKAKAEGRSFQEMAQHYSMERFLYRLSKSEHSRSFILKGAMMLQAWHFQQSRPTMDIDMLGRTDNDVKNISCLMKEIMSVDVEADGIFFIPESMRTERITEDADYMGIRVLFEARLDTVRLNIKVDIGFGDIIFPCPEEMSLPTLIDYPQPRVLCYSLESAIAEKFEAMVKLNIINSRMKDFYDIWMIAGMFEFEGEKLAEAVKHTFENRATNFPDKIAAFSDGFIKNKQGQWTAFRKKLGQTQVPSEFSMIISLIRQFLEPVALSLASGSPLRSKWISPGHWKN